MSVKYSFALNIQIVKTFPMLKLEQQIKNVKDAVTNFRYQMSKPVVHTFPRLHEPLERIQRILDRLSVDFLSDSPVENLNLISRLVGEAAQPVADFMLNAYPESERNQHGTVRPGIYVINEENISKWETNLHSIHKQLFDLLSPIILLQESRLFKMSLSPIITVCSEQSQTELDPEENVWRYMSLKNLLRCSASSGIWMSSLRKLKQWSTRGIVDTKEGDVPPVLKDIKDEYTMAAMIGDKSFDAFLNKYNLREDEIPLLNNILDVTFDDQRLFVSSWIRRSKERSGMWSHYGDFSKGVAIKCKLGKLLKGPWRLPLELSETTTGPSCQKLILRDVHYCHFDDTDRVQGIYDFYLPFLKREEFEEERELRLLAISSASGDLDGFSLMCNLHNLIEEIVVGPHGDIENAKRLIDIYAADLRGIHIRKSSLAL